MKYYGHRKMCIRDRPGTPVTQVNWGTTATPKHFYAIWGYDINVQFEDEKGYSTNDGTAVSYTHLFFAEVQHFLCHGISQGKEQSHDFRQTCKSEVQVWQSAFLMRHSLHIKYQNGRCSRLF